MKAARALHWRCVAALCSLALCIDLPSALAQASPQPATTAFCDRLQALTADSPAHWGISVTTLAGEPLCEIHAAQLFRPASNAKLLTTVTAFALLGPESAAGTTLSLAKNGDLVLRGAGDAFLSQRVVPYAVPPVLPPGALKPLAPPNPLDALAQQVVDAGLLHVHGDIVGDDTAWPREPYAPDWSIDDAVWGYGAPVSALSIDDNQITLTVTPGLAVGALATITTDPLLPYYALDAEVRTTAAKTPLKLEIERLPNARTLRIYGTIPLGPAHEEELAIDDPAEYAALYLKSLLEARGVVVDGHARARHRASTTLDGFTEQVEAPLASFTSRPAPVEPAPLASHTAPTLLEDATITLKVSQNLHAELFLHQLAARFGSDGSTAQGVRVVRQFLLRSGLDAADFHLFDGSGLSGHDLVSPRAMTKLLAFAARQPWSPGFRAALPQGCTDGSLIHRFCGTLKGRVQAKTGTLGESRALSGYVTGTSGDTLLFSILDDNHPPSSSADRVLMDQMVEAIAAAN